MYEYLFISYPFVIVQVFLTFRWSFPDQLIVWTHSWGNWVYWICRMLWSNWTRDVNSLCTRLVSVMPTASFWSLWATEPRWAVISRYGSEQWWSIVCCSTRAAGAGSPGGGLIPTTPSHHRRLHSQSDPERPDRCHTLPLALGAHIARVDQVESEKI